MTSWPTLHVIIQKYVDPAVGQKPWLVSLTQPSGVYITATKADNLREAVQYAKNFMNAYQYTALTSVIQVWTRDGRGNWCHLKENTHHINDLNDEAELAVLILRWQ